MKLRKANNSLHSCRARKKQPYFDFIPDSSNGTSVGTSPFFSIFICSPISHISWCRFCSVALDSRILGCYSSGSQRLRNIKLVGCSAVTSVVTYGGIYYDCSHLKTLCPAGECLPKWWLSYCFLFSWINMYQCASTRRILLTCFYLEITF